MDGEAINLEQPQNPRTRERALLVEDIPVALDCTLPSAAKHLDIGCVLNEDHITTCRTGPVDNAVDLESPR